MLDRKSFSVAFTISLISLAGCSGPPETPLSPTPAIHMASALTDDSSTLKVGAPIDLGPNGVSVGTMRPTLTFTNPTGALAASDGNWGLISKNPGEQQCTWDFCAPADGSGYGEDIVAYHTGNGNWEGWDIVAGAGGPGAGVQWNFVSGRRAGNDWRPVPPFP